MLAHDDAEFGELRQQAGGQRIRLDLPIGWEEESVADPITERRFGLLHLVTVQVLRVVTGGFEGGQALAVLVEPFPGLEGQQHSAIVHLEIDALSLVLVEQLVRILAEAQMEVEPGLEVTRIAVSGHAQEELEIAGSQRGFDRQRAVGPEHPLDALEEDAGSRNRIALGDRDLRGVSVRGAGAAALGLDDRDLVAPNGQLVGRGQSDHATADYDSPHPVTPIGLLVRHSASRAHKSIV